MGAILNGISMTGVYQYYSYYQEYESTDEPTERLPASRGGAVEQTALPGGGRVE
jgi:hypothetical protein